MTGEIVQCAAVLPACAYNYQPYIPSPPPAVVPWTRRTLYQQVMSTSAPVFLSCNLTNPVHLASILAHGCSEEVVEQVAEMMTPATLKASGVVNGVIVGGMVWEAEELLDECFRRRLGEEYNKRMVEVNVTVEDGGVVSVCAYVYSRRQ